MVERLPSKQEANSSHQFESGIPLHFYIMKNELLIQSIVKHLVFSQDKVIGVVIEDHNRKAYIQEEVKLQLDQIHPKYLAPTLVRRNRSCIETDTGVKLMFFTNTNTIKGYSFDLMYVCETVEAPYLLPMTKYYKRI